MDPAPEDQLTKIERLERMERREQAAADALGTLLEDPEYNALATSHYEPRRTALLEALKWLEADTTCTDCLEGHCHRRGDRSHSAITAAAAGEDSLDPRQGECGCARHEISMQTRQRRVRLQAAGILP